MLLVVVPPGVVLVPWFICETVVLLAGGGGSAAATPAADGRVAPQLGGHGATTLRSGNCTSVTVFITAVVYRSICSTYEALAVLLIRNNL